MVASLADIDNLFQRDPKLKKFLNDYYIRIFDLGSVVPISGIDLASAGEILGGIKGGKEQAVSEVDVNAVASQNIDGLVPPY
jgi:hypothetical protein